MSAAFHYFSAAVLVLRAKVASQHVEDLPSSSYSSEDWLEDAGCDSTNVDAVSFMQMDSLSLMDPKPLHLARLNPDKPVAWLQVPRTGSRFMNTLIHNPTFCPYTPEDFFLRHDELDADIRLLETFFDDFDEKEYCPGVSKTYPLSAIYAPIATAYSDHMGQWVTMLRQPEQRLISEYYHERDVEKSVLDGVSAKDYATWHQGHVVNLLTMGVLISQWNIRDAVVNVPSKAEVAMAITRLREGFAFVGLTEEWSLSICLFHAMFGGTCVTEEFQDAHPGTNRTSNHDPYDTSILEGFIDVHDAPVYQEGARMFETGIKQYGVLSSNCPSSCKKV